MSEGMVVNIGNLGQQIIINYAAQVIIYPDGRRTPFMAPQPPRSFVGQKATIDDLHTRLVKGGALALCAFSGKPGIGKTALATMLVHDPVVLSHYSDGVLWAGLGPHPNLSALLGEWGNALGLDLGKVPDVADRAERIQEAIGMRRMLLVVDDAWQPQTALIFKNLRGKNSARLLTTRNEGIALDFAESTQGVVIVSELDEDSALKLLDEIAPQAVVVEPEAVHELVRALGGLPLAVKLAGGVLAKAAKQRRWVQQALERLKVVHEVLQLKQEEERLGLEGIPITLQAIIGLSYDALIDELQGPDKLLGLDCQRTYRMLGFFAPKPASFSRQAAQAVCELQVNALDRVLQTLTLSNLLEVTGEDRFTLHQVLAIDAFSRCQTEEVDLARRHHATHYLALIREHMNEWQLVERELTQIQHGHVEAVKNNDAQAVVDFTLSMQQFHNRRGLWHDQITWGEGALQATETLQDQGAKVEILNGIGESYLRLGQPSTALEYSHQALSIIRTTSDRPREIDTLNLVGMVHQGISENVQALECFQQALEIARDICDKKREGLSLSNLGTVYYDTGPLSQSLEYQTLARSVRQAAGDREGEEETLSNIGTVYHSLGEPKRSFEYYELALGICRELGLRYSEALVWNNIAAALKDTGDVKGSLAYFEKVLISFKEVGARDEEALALHNLSAVYKALGDIEKATSFAEQALHIYQSIGDLSGQGYALRTLGVCAQIVGNHEKSISLLMEANEVLAKARNEYYRAYVLASLGETYYAQRLYEQAFDYCNKALELHRAVENKSGEQQALDCLATIDRARQDSC